MTGNRLIGGFFGLELPEALGGFISLWDVPARPAFANARSALAALVEATAPPKVWLPAYICAEMADAVPAGKLAFYPVGDGLTPDIGVLESSARPGDLVLAVNFFGRAPAREFLDFVGQRTDLVVVEDCAHSIDTGVPAWGHWRLFSPRKLMGVPDGGLLIPSRPQTIIPTGLASEFDMAIFEAALRRFEDEEETRNASWHAANQARESAGQISNRRMSRLSRTLLGLLDPGPVIRRRKENFAALQERLAQFAFLKDRVPAYVPFGFPVRVDSRRRHGILSALSARGIFAACHWNDLPSPAGMFPAEHQLAAELITLPCDQRYGPEDMAQVAAEFAAAVS